MTDSEVVRFADQHSGVVSTSPGRLNPYKMGVELLRDIEDRWNKGKFGKEYERCDDLQEKQHWDRQLGLGREKLFEIRKLYNDVTHSVIQNVVNDSEYTLSRLLWRESAPQVVGADQHHKGGARGLCHLTFKLAILYSI